MGSLEKPQYKDVSGEVIPSESNGYKCIWNDCWIQWQAYHNQEIADLRRTNEVTQELLSTEVCKVQKLREGIDKANHAKDEALKWYENMCKENMGLKRDAELGNIPYREAVELKAENDRLKAQFDKQELNEDAVYECLADEADYNTTQ